MKKTSHAGRKICPLCGGTLKSGRTSFTADLGFGIVVVRRVPATVCSQCGEDWIGAKDARRIEAIVEQARAGRREIEVVRLAG